MTRAKPITEHRAPKSVVLKKADADHLLNLMGLPFDIDQRVEIMTLIAQVLTGYRIVEAKSPPASVVATLAPLLDHAAKLQAGIKALPSARRLDLRPHEAHAIADEELSRIVAALSDTIDRHKARISRGRKRAPLLMTTQQLEGIFERYAGERADLRGFLDAALDSAGISHSDPFTHPGRILP